MGIRVIPVLVIGDDVVLDLVNRVTTIDAWYSVARVHVTHDNFCHDILGHTKWVRFYFIEHDRNNMIGFLIRGDEIDVRGISNNFQVQTGMNDEQFV
jgi:hypothetical protein